MANRVNRFIFSGLFYYGFNNSSSSFNLCPNITVDNTFTLNICPALLALLLLPFILLPAFNSLLDSMRSMTDLLDSSRGVALQEASSVLVPQVGPDT